MSSRIRRRIEPLLADLKVRMWQAGLPDDARERASFERVMEGNRDCERGMPDALLHNPMASTLADRGESVLSENPANLVT